jgi:tetratricopeptide (TPR) repeat protein
VFAKLPVSDGFDHTAGGETLGLGGEGVAPVALPTASDYSAKAEVSLNAGNLALAVQQYSQAVSTDPANVKLRVKLAEVFARKGMYDQALDELDRASRLGTDAEMLDLARKRITRMRGGESQVIVEPEKPVEQPPTDEVRPVGTPGPAGEVTPAGDAAMQAVSKMVQGDKLWNQGKPDDAAQAYASAVKLNPSDWRGLERLAAVNASMSLYNEARKAVEQLKIVQPAPSPDTVSNRYEMFCKAFDGSFDMLLKQYDTDSADFQAKVITRESYYNSVNGVSMRLQSMVKFLDALRVPPARESANLRRSLACGLVAQAAASSLDYLETNDIKAKANAEVFLAQARKEIDAARKLDENKVVVDTKTSPAPPAQEQDTSYEDWNEYDPEVQADDGSTVTPAE